MVYGIDPARLMDCDDPVELLVLGSALDCAIKIGREHRTDLANKIAKAVMGEG